MDFQAYFYHHIIAIFPTDFVLRLWHVQGYKSMPLAEFGLLRFFFKPFLLDECSI